MALAGCWSLKRCVYWILEKYVSGWLLEFEEMGILDMGEVWLYLAVGV